jgi:hypothetical protein
MLAIDLDLNHDHDIDLDLYLYLDKYLDLHHYHDLDHGKTRHDKARKGNQRNDMTRLSKAIHGKERKGLGLHAISFYKRY